MGKVALHCCYTTFRFPLSLVHFADRLLSLPIAPQLQLPLPSLVFTISIHIVLLGRVVCILDGSFTGFDFTAPLSLFIEFYWDIHLGLLPVGAPDSFHIPVRIPSCFFTFTHVPRLEFLSDRILTSRTHTVTTQKSI